MPENGANKGVSLGETYYDSDIYDNAGQGGKSRYDGYVTSIAANDEVEDDDVENVPITQKRSGYTAPASLLNDIAQVQQFLSAHFIIVKCNKKSRITIHLWLVQLEKWYSCILFFKLN